MEEDPYFHPKQKSYRGGFNRGGYRKEEGKSDEFHFRKEPKEHLS